MVFFFILSCLCLLSISLAFPIITMWAAANVITNGWGEVEAAVVLGGGNDCYACTTKCNIKKLLSVKGRLARYMAQGSSCHMFVETSQVVIISHHQEALSKRKALSSVAMETSPHPSKYVFTKTLKIYTHIFILLLFQSCKLFVQFLPFWWCKDILPSHTQEKMVFEEHI